MFKHKMNVVSSDLLRMTMYVSFFLRCHVTQIKLASGSYLLISRSLISVRRSMNWNDNSWIFSTNIIFLNKHSSYKNEFFQVCKKLSISWFNSPCRISVIFNIGSSFLSLVNLLTQQDYHLYKISNRNTVKISYSCISSMFGIINKNNKNNMHKYQFTISYKNWVSNQIVDLHYVVI